MNDLRDKNLRNDLTVSTPINSVSKSQPQEYNYTVLIGNARPGDEVDHFPIGTYKVS